MFLLWALSFINVRTSLHPVFAFCSITQVPRKQFMWNYTGTGKLDLELYHSFCSEVMSLVYISWKHPCPMNIFFQFFVRICYEVHSLQQISVQICVIWVMSCPLKKEKKWCCLRVRVEFNIETDDVFIFSGRHPVQECLR